MANECVPLFRPGADVSAVTTAAVVGKTFVAWSAALVAAGSTNAGLPSVATATAAGKIAGVAAYDAGSGARVAVIRNHGAIVPITAGGTISALAEVEVGSGGKAVTIASGVAVGRALVAGTNNNDCFIELY